MAQGETVYRCGCGWSGFLCEMGTVVARRPYALATEFIKGCPKCAAPEWDMTWIGPADAKPPEASPSEVEPAPSWEDVTATPDVWSTARLKAVERFQVPGGWLYRVGGGAPVFVPEPRTMGQECPEKRNSEKPQAGMAHEWTQGTSVPGDTIWLDGAVFYRVPDSNPPLPLAGMVPVSALEQMVSDFDASAGVFWDDGSSLAWATAAECIRALIRRNTEGGE